MHKLVRRRVESMANFISHFNFFLSFCVCNKLQTVQPVGLSVSVLPSSFALLCIFQTLIHARVIRLGVCCIHRLRLCCLSCCLCTRDNYSYRAHLLPKLFGHTVNLSAGQTRSGKVCPREYCIYCVN